MKGVYCRHRNVGVPGPPQPLLPFATRAPGGGGTGEHVELPVVEWVRFGCATPVGTPRDSSWGQG